MFALFDLGVSETEKEKIAQKLITLPRAADVETGKPGQPNFNPIAAHLTAERPSLSDFITARSWRIFDLLNVAMPKLHWLTLSPTQWNQFESFLYMRSFIEDMQVVNDAAERAVKAVGEFAHMTRRAVDRDEVVLVANDHRGRIGNLRRCNLNYV